MDGAMANLPPGWKRYLNSRGRMQYDSPPPITHIRSKSQLLRYQRQGKYLDLDGDSLNFLVKKSKTEKNHVILQQGAEPDDEPNIDIPEDISEHGQADMNLDPPEDVPLTDALIDGISVPLSSLVSLTESSASLASLSDPQTNSLNDASSRKRMKTVEHDLEKINSAVKLLTIDDTENLDHKKELKAAAKLLNDARIPVHHETNLEELKSVLMDSADLESLVHQVWSHPEARNMFQQMETSSSLEDFLQIGRTETNGPLKTFPPNVNENIYHEIVKFSLEKSKSTVIFLINLLVEKNKPITAHDVIHIAYIFSYVAHKVNRDNSALVKLKTLLVQKEGITSEGVDALATLGVTESSRSLRNQKDFLAGISTELVKSSATSFPHQSTVDNIGKMLNILLFDVKVGMIYPCDKCGNTIPDQYVLKKHLCCYHLMCMLKISTA